MSTSSEMLSVNIQIELISEMLLLCVVSLVTPDKMPICSKCSCSKSVLPNCCPSADQDQYKISVLKKCLYQHCEQN